MKSKNLKTICAFIVFITALGTFTPKCHAAQEESTTGSFTLEECVTVARKNNPRVIAAQEKIAELTADYNAARSRFFPTFTVISYLNKLGPSDRLSGGGMTDQRLYGRESLNSVMGKQLLFDGLKTYFSTKAATIGKEAQKKETERVLHEVEFSVTEAFYRLLEAQENKKVAQKALEQRRDFERLTNAFYTAGKVTRLDFFRAESQVYEAEQAVIEAENAQQLAQLILIKTMGIERAAPIAIDGDVPKDFPAVSDFNTLWQLAQKNNPEIKRLDLDIEQSKKLIQAAKSDYFPEISLQGDIGNRHRDRGGTKDEWTGGVFMEFPFFEGGLTRAQVAKATSQNLQLVELKRNRIDEIRVELMDAVTGLENARHGVETARQTIKANTEGYNSSFTLYKYGKAIGLDVLQAQVELTRSQFYFISSAIAYEINYSRIKQIVGTELSASLYANRTMEGP